MLKSQIYISEITCISSYLANSTEFCKYFWNFLKPGMSEIRTGEVCRSQETLALSRFQNSSWIAGIQNSETIVRIHTESLMKTYLSYSREH